MTIRFRHALLWSLLAACPLAARAQVDSGNEIPDVTRTYALVNARVVQAPGQILERATVVIRDGLIANIGPEVPIPFDAERIAADSLTVYAGFIDGLSHAGIPAPKGQARVEPPDNPGYPSDQEAGIVPGLDVRTLLKADDKSITDMRSAGFTAAHVVPRGRMLPGTSAIILLAGETANELVYLGNAAAFAQLASARRMYPGTDMAVIAKMRQLFREAKRRQQMERQYAQDPTGMPRPAYDPTHYALFPVLSGNRSIFFHTEDALDAHRALALHEELGFGMVLSGLNQSFDVLEKLKDADIALLLSLDLPEAKNGKKSGEETVSDSTRAQPTDTAGELPEVAKQEYDPSLRVRDFRDVEAEKANLEARRDAERQKYLESAGRLQMAGLSFGFTMLDTKPQEVLPSVRLLIENGLTEEAALAALTTNPARILGVSAAMGSVEAGKMGNLVVATGNVFEEDTKIRYVFVDGRKYELDSAEKKPAKSDGNAPVVAGTWSVTAATPDGDIDGTLVLNRDLTGTVSFDMMPEELDITDAAFEDSELSFSFTIDGLGTVTITVTVTGDEFEGEAFSEAAGTASFSGKRTADPEYQP